MVVLLLAVRTALADPCAQSHVYQDEFDDEPGLVVGQPPARFRDALDGPRLELGRDGATRTVPLDDERLLGLARGQVHEQWPESVDPVELQRDALCFAFERGLDLSGAEQAGIHMR